MCGIAAALIGKAASAVPAGPAVLSGLARRGPDCHGGVNVQMRDGLLRLQGHVLHLRGGTPAAQPYGIDVSGVPTPPLPLSETVSGADVVVAQADTHWLLLNGQVYEGLPGLDAAASDTAALAAALAAASTASDSAVAAALGGVVAALRGPFALVWWDVSREELWFARDATGRRSLCVAATEATLHLASTATNDITEDNDHFVRWHELPAAGLYRARLDAAGQLAHVTLYPWPSASGYVDAALAVFAPLPVRVEAPLLPPNLMTKPVTGGDAVDGLGAVLGRAVALRVATFANGESRDALPSVGVLFSGGVDCMVLAALAARALPPGMPIDLLTVAFENRRRKAFDAASAFDVPDRKTAIAGAEELRKIAPDRQWRLIGVNVTAEALEAKRSHIRGLIAPLRTELDDSLGCALWFAARGEGWLLDAAGQTGAACTSTAPVLLLGMGADEQLGGYSRHRSTFERGGQSALAAEVAMDVARIAERNLGRDDRVVADHGKDGRYPFLDEDVMAYLAALPLAEKMDLSLPRGVGEKHVLRELARRLGIPGCAGLPKRAIQFGSRIAKMYSGKARATDVFE